MEGSTSTCPRCGADLTGAPAPGGLCPKCLMQVGLESQAAEGEVVVTSAAGPPREAPPSVEDLVPRFPELAIESLIGRGGMGAVYRARHKGLDRLIALKILPSEAARDPAFAERFAREARALARLSHPGIVSVFDSGERGGLYFFAMEFVDGTTLRHIIQARSTTPRQALAIVTQVCDALQYAHEEGVVHRDIKPENILIDKRGRAKIADFGLSKLVCGEKGELTLTRSGQTMGTPHYMAPEQWEKPHEVDHRADIFSLGVVFYELLTGELPLGRFAPPSRKIEVDVKLDEVVLKTLAKEPELRYQHASQVKTEVEGISRRAEKEAAKPPRGRIRRAWRKLTAWLDPRSSGKKRIGEAEVPASWPLGALLFLLVCVIAAASASPLAILVVICAALYGLYWVVKHAA
jgi:serine/threonine protein kinase